MSNDNSYIEKWNVAKYIFVIILVINVGVLILALAASSLSPSITKETAIFVALGVIVVVSLIGFLAFFNRLSNSPDFTKGEMRKTFAITIIMIYLLILSLVLTNQIDFFPTSQDGEELTEQGEFNKDLLENFSYVVITVIIFYFGSRTYQQARATKKDEDESSSVADKIEKAEAEAALTEAESIKAKAATSIAESELTIAKTEKSKAEEKVGAATEKIESTTEPAIKKAAELELTKAKEEVALAEDKVEKAEKKVTKTKTAEAKAELKAELALEKEKDTKKSILKTKDSVSKAKTEAVLATMEATKAKTEVILAKAEATKTEVENEKIPTKDTTSKIGLKKETVTTKTSSAPSPPILDLQIKIKSEFKEFVDKNKDNVTGQNILDFKRKFTESIGELVAKENDSINEQISELDVSDPDMPKKKQRLLEKKSQVTKNLAFREIDRISLCNNLNDILKQDVPNLSLSKLMEEMNLADMTAREIAQLISEGLIKPMHIGKKSFEVLKQEYFSIKNSFTPTTFSKQEMQVFNEKLKILMAEIQHLPEDQQEILFDMVDDMLNP